MTDAGFVGLPIYLCAHACLSVCLKASGLAFDRSAGQEVDDVSARGVTQKETETYREKGRGDRQRERETDKREGEETK